MASNMTPSPRMNPNIQLQQQNIFQQQQSRTRQPPPSPMGASYFEDDNDDSPPLKPVRRGGKASSRVQSTQNGTRKKKINAVSQSSLATFHPGYVGMDEHHMEPSWSQSSAGSSSTATDAWSSSASGSYQMNCHPQASPTPELEAFLVSDMETALRARRDSQDGYDDWVDAGAGRGRHRRAGTMASVFEDDADGPQSPTAKTSPARKVAFLMRTASTDSNKALSPSKWNKALPSATASPLARFFGWRKLGKNSSKSQNSDDSVPTSAPPHITTFAESFRSPGLEPDFGSEGVGGGASLPNTPLSNSVALPGSPNVMPHRRPGPPPRSILRKQSAPALRNARSSEAEAASAAALPRSFEAPASFSNRKDGANTKRRNPPSALVGLSSSSSSELSSSASSERIYSTVGRGVARDRSSSFSSIASSASGQPKSPRRKPVNKRFEGIPNSPSPNSPAMRLHSPPTQPVKVTGYLGPPTLPSLPCLSSTTSMAQLVANGFLGTSHGYEEPAPRTQPPSPALLSVEQLAQPKTLRRRSRSVGAMDVQDTFSAALSAFGDQGPQLQTELAPSRVTRAQTEQPSSLDDAKASLQPAPVKSSPKVTSKQTGTSAVVASPRPTITHKVSDSVQSHHSDSDSSDSAEVHTVQVRRVQLVNTRVKATTVSSPSLASVTRSPRLGDGSPSLRTDLNASSPQPALAASSPLLTAPRVLQHGAPSTPERRFLSNPHAVSPASTLGLSDDDGESILHYRQPSRDTRLLELSFAGLDMNAASAMNDSALDYGFPSCPQTKPLNIKARQRLVSNFSEASDASLSSSVGSTADSEVSEADSIGARNEFPFPMTNQSNVAMQQQQGVPQITALDSEGSMDSTASSSLPSLTSSDSEMSDPPQSSAGLLTVTSSASSNSLASMLTTDTSILDLGMPHEEARRFVHRGQLSEDAFSYNRKQKPDEEEEQCTPTLSNGPFKPAINVIGPDAKRRPQLELDFEPGGSLGLSLGPFSGRRGSSASSRRSSRSITPTQQMYRAASPLMKKDARAGSPAAEGGLGLGLGFKFGGNLEQPRPVMQCAPHMSMGQQADFGTKSWEDYQDGEDKGRFEPASELGYCQENSEEYGQEWEMGVAM